MKMSSICSLSLLLAITCASSVTFASPWTVPPDELVLTLDQDFQFADREFLPDGTAQLFPLNGTYRSHTTRVGARYGFTERFEGAVDLNFSMVNYNHDPVILNGFDEGASAGEATATIRNFNTSEFGAGDFYFHGRYNLFRGSFLVTTATTIKLPTGYTTPTGTFVTGADGSSLPGGQATLGDGQSDLTQSLLFGTYIAPIRTFMRLDTGLRYRFGDPGHQATANFRAGKFIGDRFVLAAGAGYLKTITEGEVIGDTYTAIDPTIAATEFRPDNVRVLPLRLDRDALTVDAGILISIADIEFTANYGQTLLGINTAAVHAFSVGAIFAFPNAVGR